MKTEIMDDSINRQDAIDVIYAWCKYSLLDVDAIIGDIKALPSARPEIIRCGKCTHKDKKIDYCHYLGITICENDYCSYAVRRTDE